MSQITKEQAREMLERFFTNRISHQIEVGLTPHVDFPIKDEVFNTISSPEPKIATTLKEQDELNDRPLCFERWSFKGLIKIAYDLQDKT